jgi:integrase
MIKKHNSYYSRIRETKGGRRGESTVALGGDYGLALAKHRQLERRREEWRGQPTVRDFSKIWLADYVRSMRTGKGPALAAQRLNDYVLPVLGDMAVPEVTEAHGMKLRAMLERPHKRALPNGKVIETELSSLSVRHVLSDARCLFGFAIAARLIDRNPIVGRVFPRIQEEIPDPLSDIELGRVLQVVPEQYELLVGLALWTGLRYSELRGLAWERIELAGDPHLLVVRSGHAEWTKSRRARRVPALPEAVRILEHAPRTSPWVFTGRFGEMISEKPGPFNRVIAEDVPGYHFHRLRHTFASRFIRAGGQLPILQRILGHSSIRTTERYVRLFDSEVSAQTRALPAGWMPDIVLGEGRGKIGGSSI